jgi:hypothetical protein
VQHAVVKLKEVPFGGFISGVAQRGIVWGSRPVVVFILIAGSAAIDKVVKAISAAFGTGLEVINGEMAPDIRLGDTTKFAGELGAGAPVRASSR